MEASLRPDAGASAAGPLTHSVTRGLDPRVHLLRKRLLAKEMDCRIKPGNDGWSRSCTPSAPQLSRAGRLGSPGCSGWPGESEGASLCGGACAPARVASGVTLAPAASLRSCLR